MIYGSCSFIFGINMLFWPCSHSNLMRPFLSISFASVLNIIKPLSVASMKIQTRGTCCHSLKPSVRSTKRRESLPMGFEVWRVMIISFLYLIARRLSRIKALRIIFFSSLSTIRSALSKTIRLHSGFLRIKVFIPLRSQFWPSNSPRVVLSYHGQP